MTQGVQVKCPGCRKILTIPAGWGDTPLRCRHCSTVFKCRPNPATAKAAPRPAAKAAPRQPANAAPRPVRPRSSGFAKLMFFGFWLLGAAGVAFCLVWANRRPAVPAPKDQVATVIPQVDPGRPPKTGTSPTPNPTDPGANPKPVNPPPVISTNPQPKPRLVDPPPPVDDPKPKPSDPVVETPKPKPKPKPPPPPGTDGLFPRRALAVAVNNYLFANPVAYGPPGRDVNSVLNLLARNWRIAPTQVVELSDRAGKPVAPTKAMIEQTVSRFLDTSRAQDRIVLLFAGHAVEVDDQPYLVPLEGDLTDKTTLIPLSWLYGRLAACRARQKVLVMDVARFDPQLGEERPSGGPLGAKLDALLQAPPPGVEVWSACVAGQFSYEAEINNVPTGIFMNQLFDALTRLGRNNQKPRQEESLPLAALVEGVGRQTTGEAQRLQQAQQTPRLSGQEAAGGASYDPEEAPPPPLAIEVPPVAGMPVLEDVRAILAEVNAGRLQLTHQGTENLKADVLAPLLPKGLDDYRAVAPDQNPIRQAVEKAHKVLEQNQGKRIQEKFLANNNDAQFNQAVMNQQKEAAKILLPLTDVLDELQKVGEKVDEEPSKRLQADYYYLLGRVTAELAFLNEYDALLGDIRKQKPPRDPATQQGWRLVSQEKLQGDSNSKKTAVEARKILDKVAKEFPGTPWAVLAKRDRLTRLGLEWKAGRIGR